MGHLLCEVIRDATLAPMANSQTDFAAQQVRWRCLGLSTRKRQIWGLGQRSSDVSETQALRDGDQQRSNNYCCSTCCRPRRSQIPITASMKLGPSSGPAVSSLEVYTTPALHGARVVIGAPLREGVLQTLTIGDSQFCHRPFKATLNSPLIAPSVRSQQLESLANTRPVNLAVLNWNTRP